jgi:predicted nucleic acid-binding protein
LSIDLGASLRRIKSDKYRAPLRVRAKGELVAAADVTGAGRAALLLDTNMYIHAAAGTLPAAAAALVDRGLLFYCSVCVAELATGVAHADPSRAGWRRMRDHYEELIVRLPATRLMTPYPQVWTDAGVIARTLARRRGSKRAQRKECLNVARST